MCILEYILGMLWKLIIGCLASVAPHLLLEVARPKVAAGRGL